MKNKISLLSLLGLVLSPLALGGHGGTIGTVDYLHDQAQDLNADTQKSTLRYEVKSSVSQFFNDVTDLHRCSDAPVPEDHGASKCLNELQRVVYSWSPVERYLCDTMSDYPTIYNLYTEARRALYAIPEVNNLPQNHLYARGTMNGAYYNLQDATQNGIYNQCIDFGRRNGIYSVRTLTVNSFTVYYGYSWVTLTEACTAVSRYARQQ